MAVARSKGDAGMKRSDPKAAPVRLKSGASSARHLPDGRNSGWTSATFLGGILNAGYSGASNHSSVNSPASIRFTVASQKPSNSFLSFQYAASTRAPICSASQGFGCASGGSGFPGALDTLAIEVVFTFCSGDAFMPDAAALSGFGAGSALAALHAYSSIRR